MSERAAGFAPSVTVLMPVRNGQETLPYALADLVTGLTARDELLVIDDGSSDGTARILEDWGHTTPQLRVIRTSGKGLVAALNTGLREATHRLIARADADDRYPDGGLARQRDAWEEGVVLVSGDYRARGNGRLVGQFPTALTHPFVAASLIHPQRIPHPGVLLDGDAALEAGGYRSEDFPAEDLALWLRLAGIGRMIGVPHVTVDWTMNRGSISHTRQAEQRSKTARLVASGLHLGSIRSLASADVDRELDSYRATRLTFTRSLLLARDLRALRLLGLKEDAYRASLRFISRHPLGSLVAAGTVISGKFERDRLRREFAKDA